MMILAYILFWSGITGIGMMLLIEITSVFNRHGPKVTLSSVILVPTLFLAAAVAKYFAS